MTAFQWDEAARCALICAMTIGAGCVGRPTLQDISPDAANGANQASASTAGLTVALAGNTSRVYAVSLNAGVWRSDGADHAWEQLTNSPPRAYSIASDPRDNQHVIVGEREDDKSDLPARHSGVWETRDGGDTWSYILDPVTVGCTAQAVPSVAINAEGDLFAATSCGVARRSVGSTTFAIAAETSGLGNITALATSPHAVWARTSDRLLIGDAPGQLWSVKAIPDYAVNAQPATDLYSLAPTDTFAYFTCCSKSIPPNCPDAANPGTFGSVDTMLVYDLSLDAWTLQPAVVNGTPALGCDGTELGGSKFVRAYSITSAPGLPIVRPVRLFYSAAQDIYEATGFNANGTVSGWSRILSTANGDNVHSDLWDFLLDPRTAHLWVASDGGVFERTSLETNTPWVSRNQGLHTHHVHTLTLMGGSALPAPALTYPTSDNDAWYSTQLSSPTSWHVSSLGDVNWTAGDVANTHRGIVVRQPGNGQAASVRDTSPYIVGVSLRHDAIDGPASFHFIQTLAGEAAPDTTLDAVMLTMLPLQYFDAGTKTLQNVPGSLGDASNAGRLVVLRHHHFESAEDINVGKGAGWSVEVDPPAGTSRFWVTGGHDNPLYFALASDASGKLKLFKQNGWANGRTQWQELNVQGRIADPRPYPDSRILSDDHLWKGPVFVNPYNRDEIFVLTTGGVRVSQNGGAEFTLDKPLTALVNGGGAYPLTPAFPGGDPTGVRKANRSDLNAMGALADLAFLREDPSVAVASSPYTGLFYRSGGQWLDLAPFLPAIRTPISSVAIDTSSIYFATEGRGVFRLIGYSRAARYLWAKSLAARWR